MSENFEDLLGKTLVRIDGAESGHDEITLVTAEGERYRLWHNQDCCENVRVADVIGDVRDLLDTPLTLAEEVSNAEGETPECPDSWTWTFYKLSTIKGSVTIRWLGESNGYYSESVDFCRLEDA